MTIWQALKWAETELTDHDIPDARSAAVFLLAFVLDCEPNRLALNREKLLTPVEVGRFEAAVKERAAGRPAQYIAGYQHFCGLRLAVTEAVLIPRPETELLVEQAANWLQKQANQKLTILDVGTGSGAIILALAHEFAARQSNWQFIGSDNSRDALSIAKANAKALGLAKTVQLIESDLIPAGAYPDIIIANLSYIPSDKIKKLDRVVKDYEPITALDGGPDGLQVIRQLFGQIDRRKERPKIILLEIDESQGESITNLVKDYWPQAKVSISQDLAGLNRFCQIELI